MAMKLKNCLIFTVGLFLSVSLIPQSEENGETMLLPPLPALDLMSYDSLEMTSDSADLVPDISSAVESADSLLPPPEKTASPELFISDTFLEIEPLDTNAIYFLNLPWGADTLQIRTLLTQQHYEKQYSNLYQKSTEDDTALLKLDFQKNRLKSVELQLISLDKLPEDTLMSRFKDLQMLLIERYGLPTAIREYVYDPQTANNPELPSFLKKNIWKKEGTILELQIRYQKPKMVLIYGTEQFDEDRKKSFKERIIKLF
jgi:hypothetical protein